MGKVFVLLHGDLVVCSTSTAKLMARRVLQSFIPTLREWEDRPLQLLEDYTVQIMDVDSLATPQWISFDARALYRRALFFGLPAHSTAASETKWFGENVATLEKLILCTLEA